MAMAVNDRVGAVLVAAGLSTRMGFDKLWAPLGDGPVLLWSVLALAGSGVVDRLALVVGADRVEDARRLVANQAPPPAIVVGGERRRDSVAAGVDALDDCDWLLVHDAARPFLSSEVARQGLAEARFTGASVPAVPVRDTIKRVRDSRVVDTLPRPELWAVQTPQVFRRALLRDALAATDEDVTDEATLVESLGTVVRVFPGDDANMKITTPADLELARALVELRGTGHPS